MTHAVSGKDDASQLEAPLAGQGLSEPKLVERRRARAGWIVEERMAEGMRRDFLGSRAVEDSADETRCVEELCRGLVARGDAREPGPAVKPLVVRVGRREADRTARDLLAGQRSNPGVPRRADGPLPGDHRRPGRVPHR